jgi:vancomycin permeability regulator SanA
MKTDKVNKGSKRIKMKKVIAIGAIAIIIGGALVGVGVIGINTIMIQATKQDIVTVSELEQADCILVLGAYVKPNGKPSDILKDRLARGYEVFEAGKAPKFLLSGDHGQKSYDEVNSMRDYIQAKGVDKKLIFLDHAGFSTYESIYRARDIFEAKKVIIVTQEYHLTRALYLAEKMGIEAQGVASDYFAYAGMQRFKAREILARVKDFIFVNVVKPEPTYLGEAIPVSGDGTATQDK